MHLLGRANTVGLFLYSQKLIITCLSAGFSLTIKVEQTPDGQQDPSVSKTLPHILSGTISRKIGQKCKPGLTESSSMRLWAWRESVRP